MKENPNEIIFKEVYESQAQGIFRFCYFKTYDRERSREIMQEAFMKTWEAIKGGKSIDNIKAYVYRVAHNLAVNEITRKKEHYSLEVLSEETGFDPKDKGPLPDVLAEYRLTIELINKLSKEYKEPLLLRYVSELPVKEIATILKESENVISVRIHRALEKLRLNQQ